MCMMPCTDAGGVLLRWNEADAQSYTHVVADHRQEPHAMLAARQGKQIVSLLWLWECVSSSRLLPIGGEKVVPFFLKGETCGAAPALWHPCSLH